MLPNISLVVKWRYNECVARVIYSLLTDRQSVLYMAKANHLLAWIFLDSNTLETTKPQMYLSDFSRFLQLHEEIPPTSLTVLEACTRVSLCFNAIKQRNTV